MKNHFCSFLLHVLLIQGIYTVALASDYTLHYGPDYGKYYLTKDVVTTNKYAAIWMSDTFSPQLKVILTGGHNNMERATGNLYVGRSTSPYEISVSEGFVITGYKIIAQAVSDNQTLTPSGGGAGITFIQSEPDTLIVDSMRSESTTFTLTGSNTGLRIITFDVYIDVDTERTADLVAHYEAALENLSDTDKYWISTVVSDSAGNSVRYFLNQEGALTPDFAQARAFTLQQASAEQTFRPIGWKATDVAFTHPYISQGFMTNVGHIMTNVEQNRDDWEAQVYLYDGEHYAIRATNVNSAENFANTYWIVTHDDADGQPEANYSENKAYIWDVSPYDPAKEASLLLSQLVEDYSTMTIGACDSGVRSIYETTLEQATAVCNGDFMSDQHSSDCIALLESLKQVHSELITSEEQYVGYQTVTSLVSSRASATQIADSPLSQTLQTLSSQLQQAINNGTATDEQFENVEGQIDYLVNYWSTHLTDADLALLHTAIEQMGDQPDWENAWDLNADELQLEGVDITEGFVTSVDLAERIYTETMPMALLQLPHLTEIDLSYTGISGTISLEENMSESIETLLLAGNSIDDIIGVVPETVNDLDITNQYFEEPVLFDLPTVEEETLLNGVPPIILYNSQDGEHYTECVLGWVPSADNYIILQNLDGELLAQFPPQFVYTYPSGTTLTFQSYYGESQGTTIPMTITYEAGDASFDGVIDIIDLQTTLNYIFDERTDYEPFNFTAADLWTDQIINAQDVVSLVYILLDHESPVSSVKARVPRRVLGRATDLTASLGFEDTQLVLNSETAIAALDITTNTSVDWRPLQAMGFNVQSRSTTAGTRTIAYSLSGATIPAGRHYIGSASIATPQVTTAKLTDKAAKSVSVQTGSDTTTGIGIITTGSAEDNCYDLTGRRQYKPTQLQKGIYIHNGQKVVNK